MSSQSRSYDARDLTADLLAGLVVFLVALPLCLGVALASDAPLFSGIVAGIVGGIVVGLLSGSQTSVSGPAAGLTAIVAAQIHALGSFEAFLAAVVLAGILQIVLGVARAGFIAAFFPSSVIKGLLAAIGVILILKQIPHMVGHDSDSIADMDFTQMDGDTTFSALLSAIFDVHYGAAIVGFGSILLLVLWDEIAVLKKSPVPAPLVVVAAGIAAAKVFEGMGPDFAIGASHLVQVPVAANPAEMVSFFQFPDWSVLTRPAVYGAAFTIAIVATLETLLNVEAVDKIDPENRQTPQNRELVAQGAGNVVSGLLGGLPMTSVIVRSSVNISAGNRTKASTVVHGLLILISVVFAADLLNSIPLSCLAAILFMTGLKLASPSLFKAMWRAGKFTFLPFIVTVVAIVVTDLLTGILVGLAVSLTFILYSNFQRPLRPVIEKRPGGDVLCIQLANQVSFLNRAALANAFYSVPKGGYVLFDARRTEYIDPDIVDLLMDFRDRDGPARGVSVSFLGFKEHYERLPDVIRFVDHSTESARSELSPRDVLRLLADGNERFRRGTTADRHLAQSMGAAMQGSVPLAVTLSCSDSRVPVETIFDVSAGDIFSTRIAGSVATREAIAGIEYACVCSGAKLVLVMAHRGCAAVGAAAEGVEGAEAHTCTHLEGLLGEIRRAFPEPIAPPSDPAAREAYLDSLATEVARKNMCAILDASDAIARLVREGEVQIVGGFYDADEGSVRFFDVDGRPVEVDVATPSAA
ncbi:MAG: bifunctional SulP family inorganic anion transporter/carbonic anhydrase [Myxococcales bacterium]|nr:bifunctional SulP family inorganic anion transporter/carbonic anhydrase [Myxococcales bacterium]